jgi:hypothetical protein
MSRRFDRLLRLLALALVGLGLLGASARAAAQETPEYRLKAAFLYNFALFTEWPAEVGSTLTLCVVGPDPFGDELNGLQGKAVGTRSLAVQRRAAGQSAAGCQLVFVAAPAIAGLPRVLEQVKGQPVLVVTDSPGAAQQGATLNMAVASNRVSFEANLRSARAAGLTLSSRLLRLATEVIQ